MDVACLQLSYPTGEDEVARVDRVLRLLDERPDTDIVVLPELWDVGYFAFEKYWETARSLEEGPLSRLADVARRESIVLVAGSVIERRGNRIHNTVAVIGPEGSVLGTYRKMHLFGYQSLERELLTPGEEPVVVRTPLGRLGVATCFDLRFPEQFAAMRDLGADTFVVPAAWPATRADHWDVLARARAIETQTPLVACNGTGECYGVELAGHSTVIDAQGAILASGGHGPGWVTATLDVDHTIQYRAEFPLRSARTSLSTSEGGTHG
jgi:predicted amidohydrolase